MSFVKGFFTIIACGIGDLLAGLLGILIGAVLANFIIPDPEHADQGVGEYVGGLIVGGFIFFVIVKCVLQLPLSWRLI